MVPSSFHYAFAVVICRTPLVQAAGLRTGALMVSTAAPQAPPQQLQLVRPLRTAALWRCPTGGNKRGGEPINCRGEQRGPAAYREHPSTEPGSAGSLTVPIRYKSPPRAASRGRGRAASGAHGRGDGGGHAATRGHPPGLPPPPGARSQLCSRGPSTERGGRGPRVPSPPRPPPPLTSRPAA